MLSLRTAMSEVVDPMMANNSITLPSALLFIIHVMPATTNADAEALRATAAALSSNRPVARSPAVAAVPTTDAAQRTDLSRRPAGELFPTKAPAAMNTTVRRPARPTCPTSLRSGMISDMKKNAAAMAIAPPRYPTASTAAVTPVAWSLSNCSGASIDPSWVRMDATWSSLIRPTACHSLTFLSQSLMI